MAHGPSTTTKSILKTARADAGLLPVTHTPLETPTSDLEDAAYRSYLELSMRADMLYDNLPSTPPLPESMKNAIEKLRDDIKQKYHELAPNQELQKKFRTWCSHDSCIYMFIKSSKTLAEKQAYRKGILERLGSERIPPSTERLSAPKAAPTKKKEVRLNIAASIRTHEKGEPPNKQAIDAGILWMVRSSEEDPDTKMGECFTEKGFIETCQQIAWRRYDQTLEEKQALIQTTMHTIMKEMGNEKSAMYKEFHKGLPTGKVSETFAAGYAILRNALHDIEAEIEAKETTARTEAISDSGSAGAAGASASGAASSVASTLSLTLANPTPTLATEATSDPGSTGAAGASAGTTASSVASTLSHTLANPTPTLATEAQQTALVFKEAPNTSATAAQGQAPTH